MGTIIQDEKHPNVSYEIPTEQELAERAEAQRLVDIENQKLEEIRIQKAFLANTDYKIIKKLEALLPKDDADVLIRQSKRTRLNELGV